MVLDGALSLAVPTKLGQSLTVELIDAPKIIWKSIDEKGLVWFKEEFLLSEIDSGISNPHNDISNRLIQILQEVRHLNPEFLSETRGYNITTKLDFPKNWGLGTSSTLITNIAIWAEVDAYELLEKTFGGSGYDIACAKHNSAITYQLLHKKREVHEVNFNPSFKDHLYFVYLNKKQNSRDAITQYKSNSSNLSNEISEISKITSHFIHCKTLGDFKTLINQHEQIISRIIKQKPIKELLFTDFNGSIKSLGAWGGDFVLVATEENPTNYFKSKGFETILTWNELILQ